ncbi:MAG: hypothetical protein GKR90_25675 [Pseudomonadales bacterium]|nr:hypothetical protein [Pseudomonadales bacterium]
MSLTVFRHGAIHNHLIAEDPGLSEVGAKAVTKRSLELLSLGVPVGMIVTSQLRRAIETSNIFSAVYPDASSYSSPVLNPSDQTSSLQDEVRSWVDVCRDGLLLIGHDPIVSQFVLDICGVSVEGREHWYIPTGSGVVLQPSNTPSGEHYNPVHYLGHTRALPITMASSAPSI